MALPWRTPLKKIRSIQFERSYKKCSEKFYKQENNVFELGFFITKL